MDARTNQAIALLDRLVSERSVLGTERGAQEVLAAELRTLGFDVEWLPLALAADDPAAGVPQLTQDQDREIVVGRRAGMSPGRRPSVLINAHLDVVPAGDAEAWTGDPFVLRETDGWLVARGAGDMKGGIAMALLAIGAVLDAHDGRLDGDLIFVGAIEEECTGNGTLASVRAGVLADVAILPESTDLNLLAGGGGVLWVEVRLSGRAGHAESGSGGVGVAGALRPLLRELDAMEVAINEVGDGLRHRINIGVVELGDWPSSVAGSARLSVRIGFPHGRDVADVEEQARAAVAAATATEDWPAGCTAEVRPSGMRAAPYELREDDELVAALRAAHADAHGEVPACFHLDATTDARFYRNQAGIPALCFGPRARNLHGADEAVELASIPAAARTLARYLSATLGEDGHPC